VKPGYSVSNTNTSSVTNSDGSVTVCGTQTFRNDVGDTRDENRCTTLSTINGQALITATELKETERTGPGATFESMEPFIGTWVGTVDQTGSRSYSVRLTLRWADGRLVGSSVYPELSNCRGDLVNPRIEGAALLVDEVIVEGKFNCIDTTLRLERSGDWLRYSFDGSHTGRAMLAAEEA
jgi:hypothetical protein